MSTPNRTAASVAAWRKAAEADAERWRRLEARTGSGELDGWALNPPADDEPDDDDDDQEEPAARPRARAARRNPAGPTPVAWFGGAVIAGVIGFLQKRMGG